MRQVQGPVHWFLQGSFHAGVLVITIVVSERSHTNEHAVESKRVLKSQAWGVDTLRSCS